MPDITITVDDELSGLLDEEAARQSVTVAALCATFVGGHRDRLLRDRATEDKAALDAAPKELRDQVLAAGKAAIAAAKVAAVEPVEDGKG